MWGFVCEFDLDEVWVEAGFVSGGVEVVWDEVVVEEYYVVHFSSGEAEDFGDVGVSFCHFKDEGAFVADE